MTTRFETTLFFATTVSALALAAVVGLQEFQALPPVQQAVTVPVIKLETVEIVAKRLPPAAVATAGRQGSGAVAN